VNGQTDSQLLRAYAEQRSEPAFAELVQRHVDLVYSAAVRLTRDPHLAKDVTQGTFVALAKSAGHLVGRAVISGWLHRTAQNIAAQMIRTEVRRRAREQEVAVMTEFLASDSHETWAQVAPYLDAALGELSESDRDAILLRYFEGKSAQAMAQALGVGEEAAQKRVSRAVERLRQAFARRGVSAGASGLGVLLASHAVSAAPAGLAVAIFQAAAVAGPLLSTSLIVTNAIAMTTLQKTILATTLVAAVGVGFYEAGEASRFRAETESLRRQQAPLRERLTQLGHAHEETTQLLNGLRAENERLSRQTAELLRLRAEVSKLTREAAEATRAAAPERRPPDDPMELAARALLGKMNRLKQRLQEEPRLDIPELVYLNNQVWARIANFNALETEDDFREALCGLRDAAKQSFASRMGKALIEFVVAYNGQLPGDVLQLKPYFDPPVDEAILQRYEMLHSGRLSDVPSSDSLIAERAPVDEKYDLLYKIGAGGYSFKAVTGYQSGSGTWPTKDVDRIKPFLRQN
jgi:RNA polymerase sigma factor (sigma-70 family)